MYKRMAILSGMIAAHSKFVQELKDKDEKLNEIDERLKVKRLIKINYTLKLPQIK